MCVWAWLRAPTRASLQGKPACNCKPRAPRLLFQLGHTPQLLLHFQVSVCSRQAGLPVYRESDFSVCALGQSAAGPERAMEHRGRGQCLRSIASDALRHFRGYTFRLRPLDLCSTFTTLDRPACHRVPRHKQQARTPFCRPQRQPPSGRRPPPLPQRCASAAPCPVPVQASRRGCGRGSAPGGSQG